mmetsp:Transcript_72967/g.117645  ORF Transcript_72967/g.117645 Transcript_72967/m.117645 type:complete len:224 (+) Transcript_72967:1274-1945(+)
MHHLVFRLRAVLHAGCSKVGPRVPVGSERTVCGVLSHQAVRSDVKLPLVDQHRQLHVLLHHKESFLGVKVFSDLLLGIADLDAVAAICVLARLQQPKSLTFRIADFAEGALPESKLWVRRVAHDKCQGQRGKRVAAVGRVIGHHGLPQTGLGGETGVSFEVVVDPDWRRHRWRLLRILRGPLHFNRVLLVEGDTPAGRLFGHGIHKSLYLILRPEEMEIRQIG